MTADVLAILLDSRSLGLLTLDVADPIIGGLCHSYALALSSVDPLAHIHLNFRLILVGVFLPLERLDVTVALLIGVIGDPYFLGLAGAFDYPCAFAD
jgi:hypothetical protein